MPTAIAVGLIIAAAFLGALMWKPIAVLAIVVLVTGLAAVEYFDKVTEKGYRPATLIGIIACIAAPLAAYWVGETAITLVLVIAFVAAATTFIGADSLQSAPMPNMAITTLGIMWIGLMGAYAALLADISNVGPNNIGTDTLFIIAVGVVANDVGALFVGSAAGRTPLRAWISPNKSVEGLIGGALLTLIAVYIVSLRSDTWNDPMEVLILGLAIAVLAPIGDLTESMFKRNLDVKDFGTLVRGHGGILDRFDGFLFVLPAAYYLLQVLEPWTPA
jgi:phosphatidate cytidylyltransferase